MRDRNAARDRNAKTDATRTRRVKRFAESGQILGTNTASAVINRYEYRNTRRRKGNPDLPSGGHCLPGIYKHIDEELL